jgi:hypothetical protein
MSEQAPLPCTCGNGAPVYEADNATNAAVLQCSHCRRCVCGYGKEEVLRMWNGAMATFAPQRNESTKPLGAEV